MKGVGDQVSDLMGGRHRRAPWLMDAETFRGVSSLLAERASRCGVLREAPSCCEPHYP